MNWGTVLEDLLSAKRLRGCSDSWIEHLESLGGVFVRARLPMRFAHAQVVGFLSGLEVSAVSRRNYLRVIKQLSRHAQRRGWLPSSFKGLDAVESPLVTNDEYQVYSPAELARIMAAAADEQRNVIALVAFCGLRVSEALRVEWARVDFERGRVTVMAKKSKTRCRRVCALARAWVVKPHDGAVQVWSRSRKSWSNAFQRLLDRAGVKAKRNGLRHSFISYRLEIAQDVQKVALQAGTSPQMIFANYRDLVTPEAAAEWFGLEPVSAQLELELVA